MENSIPTSIAFSPINKQLVDYEGKNISLQILKKEKVSEHALKILQEIRDRKPTS